MMSDLRDAAEAKFNIENYDAEYTRVNNAAAKVGKQSTAPRYRTLIRTLTPPLAGSTVSEKPWM